MSATSFLVIQGTTSNGKAFRPSDWAERLSGVFSTFGADQRMRYSPYVKPVTYNGVKSVQVDRELEAEDPRAFKFLLDFARDNDLTVHTLEQAVVG